MSHIEPIVGEFGYIAEDDERFSDESFLRSLGWTTDELESTPVNDNDKLEPRHNSSSSVCETLASNNSSKVIPEKMFDDYVDKGFTFDDASRHFFGVGIEKLQFNDGMVSLENSIRSNTSKNIAKKAINSSVDYAEIK